MNEQDAEIERTALDWTMQVQRSDFADWDALTDWLDSDPRHADCFNRLSLLDGDIADSLRQSPSKPSSRPIAAFAPPSAATALPVRHRRSQWAWAALAASVALMAWGTNGWLTSRRSEGGLAPATPRLVDVPQGEHRDIALADGTQVALAGGTRLSVDPGGRHVALERGRALFRVTHDPSHPFSVQLGNVTVTDVGTIFDLHRGLDGVDVAVQEGEVSIGGLGAPMALKAGRMARLRMGALPQVEAIDAAAVGGWRQGRFSYADATIAEVAADIASATGAKVQAAPDVAERRFAGSFKVDGDTAKALRGVAPVLGVIVSRRGDTWILGSQSDAGRS